MHVSGRESDEHVNATFPSRSGVETSVLSKNGSRSFDGNVHWFTACGNSERNELQPGAMNSFPRALLLSFDFFPWRCKATSLMALLKCEEGQRRMFTRSSPIVFHHHEVHTPNPSHVPFASFALHPTFHRLQWGQSFSVVIDLRLLLALAAWATAKQLVCRNPNKPFFGFHRIFKLFNLNLFRKYRFFNRSSIYSVCDWYRPQSLLSEEGNLRNSSCSVRFEQKFSCQVG